MQIEQPENILIVEDDILYLNLIKKELEKMGYNKIRFFSTGQEVINKLDFKPDIALLDYLSYMARVYDKKAKFKPNKKHDYSNSNYLLIAEILNRTLGYSHQDYIQAEILDPLDLTSTYNEYKYSDTSKVMSGYYVGWVPDLRSWDFPLPGGNMVATAEDVGKFLRALIDGTLFTDKEQEIYSSVYKYEHTGWLPGYCSIARYHGDFDAVIVQFVNTSKKEMFWVGLKRTYSRIARAVEKETPNNEK